MSLKFYFLITVAVFILGVPLHTSQTAQEFERKTTASQAAGQKRINPKLNQTLLNAAKNNDAKKIEELLNAEEIPNVNAQNTGSWPALIWAAYHGNTTVVQALIGAGADVNATDGYGNTALGWAALHGHTAAVQALIGAGAVVNAKDDGGNIALMQAADNGRTENVQILLKAGANSMLKNEEGQTALMIVEKKIQRNPQNAELRKIEKMLQDAENAYMAKRMNLPGRALEIGFATTGQNALPEEVVERVHEYLGVTGVPTHSRAKPSIP